MSARARFTCRFAVVLSLAFSLLEARAQTIALREIRQNLFDTCFATARHGWMVGELGRIFHTTDAGASWQRQHAGTKRPLLALACVDPSTAWVAGKAGIVFGTTDGGTTWQPAETGSARHLFTLRFPTRERGHGAGDFGTMVHTEDGGRTWTVAGVPPETKLPEIALDMGVVPGDVNLYALAYGDPEHAWLVGEFGIILVSDDGGQRWRQQRSRIDTTLFGVHFVDAARGWAVGGEGTILRTTNGGRTWRSVPGAPREHALYDVFVRDDQGWIVGDAGTLLRSGDGGATWAREPVPIELAARWLRAVWLAPGGPGLAVGSEGLVFRLAGPRPERLAGRVPGAAR